VIQKSAAGRGQLDTARVSYQQLNADLGLEFSALPAQRRLGRVQSQLRRRRETTRLGDGDKISKMPKLHATDPCLMGMSPKLTKSLCGALWQPRCLIEMVQYGFREDFYEFQQPFGILWRTKL
jgi:hypothetical protein